MIGYMYIYLFVCICIMLDDMHHYIFMYAYMFVCVCVYVCRQTYESIYV